MWNERSTSASRVDTAFFCERPTEPPRSGGRRGFGPIDVVVVAEHGCDAALLDH